MYEFIETWNARTGCRARPRTTGRLPSPTPPRPPRRAPFTSKPSSTPKSFDDWAGVLAACCDAAAEAAERHGVTIGLTPQIYRGYDTARGEEAARVATRFAGRGVVGFGLSGAEGRKPTRTARACGAGSTGWWVALRAARRRGGRSAIGA